MKIRNGFVSNSSSASFICYWRDLGWSNEKDLKMSIKQILDSYYEDGEMGRCIDSIIKHTQTTSSPGTFKTEFYISMYNDIMDVPTDFTYLITGLKLNSDEGFELIDVKVDGE